MARIRAGQAEAGLEQLEQAVRLAPENLALGNALRMQVFERRRTFQLENDGAQGLLRAPPAWLDRRSIAVFRRLAQEQPRRETRLQLAAALLDEMLLAPSLEVRAGVTFEALELLRGVLEESARGAYYLPARYARGLVYLYRPANLLWSDKIDAALRRARDDLAVCVATARQVGLESGNVGGRLALALGDTYAKEGLPERARSWWQIAHAVSPQEAVRARVRTRMTWADPQIIDRLERELDAELRQAERPLSDMSLLWE
jgi:tetratricopeptide (TPR) repeat protein